MNEEWLLVVGEYPGIDVLLAYLQRTLVRHALETEGGERRRRGDGRRGDEERRDRGRGDGGRGDRGRGDRGRGDGGRGYGGGGGKMEGE